MRGRDSLILVFTVVFLIGEVHPSCYLHNAKFTKDAPKITVPSRNDPKKVQVDWSTIIQNQKCADKYFLWVWKDGQQRGQGKKYVIQDKNTVTKIVDVQPCVFHNFRVQLEEDDSSATSKKVSAVARFNSAALPTFNSSDIKNLFKVSYYKDPSTNEYDLNKASIKIDQSFMTFADCVKHLEVSGKPKTGAERVAALKAAPSTPRPNYSLPGGDPVSWSPYPSYPSMPGSNPVSWSPYPSNPSMPGSDAVSFSPYPIFGVPGNDSKSWGPYGSGRSLGGLGAPYRMWNHGNYNPGYGGGSGFNSGSGGNSGFNPGRGGNSGYNPGTGGNSGFNPGTGGHSNYNPGTSGNSGFNPGTSGNSGYNPGTSGNSGYNPGTSGNSGYNPGSSGNSGRGGSSGFNPGTGGGWSYSTTSRPSISSTGRPSSNQNQKPNYGGNQFGSNHYKPSFWGQRSTFSNTFLRMQMPPSTKVAGPVKKAPPFTGSEIEIVVPVEPCELYDFSLKIINPQGKEIGKVDNIDLKSLADIDDFVPPPLTSVVMVDYLMGGKFQVKTLPKSPVPESCLRDYMEAVDAYSNRLETVANENTVGNAVVRKNQFYEQQLVEVTQAEFLARHGCVCSSPRLEMRMTNPSGGYSPATGVYLYKGLWEGKPYYEQDLEGRSTKEFLKLKPMAKSRRKRFIGRVDGGPSTTTKKPWEYGGYSGNLGGGPTTQRPPWNYGSHGGRTTTSSYGSYSTDGYMSSWSSWSSSSSSGSGSWSRSSSSSSSSSRRTSSGGGVQFNNSRRTTVKIPIQRVTTPSPAVPAPLPRFLYWSPTTGQWIVSTNKQSKTIASDLEGPKSNKFACPADGAQTWTGSSPRPGSTVDFGSIQLVCAPTY